jgi:hypothetical protein
MSFKSLNDEIEAVVNTISDCTFLRAGPFEANIALNKIDCSTNCIVIHYDRGESTGTKSLSGSYIYKVIPTNILFLYKNTEFDDKQTDIDTLIDQAESKADEFYDKMLQSSVIDDVAPLADYTLNRLTATKRFDAVLSGVDFECDFAVSRTQYFCS